MNLSKAKYDAAKAAILQCLRDNELTHDDLVECVDKKLRGKFSGSIPWYTEVVKLDLEARRMLIRTSEKHAEHYGLK